MGKERRSYRAEAVVPATGYHAEISHYERDQFIHDLLGQLEQRPKAPVPL